MQIIIRFGIANSLNMHIKVKHYFIRIILVYVCCYLETGFLIGLASNKLKQDVNKKMHFLLDNLVQIIHNVAFSYK